MIRAALLLTGGWGACYKHNTCAACNTERASDGSWRCAWYVPALGAGSYDYTRGLCVAGVDGDRYLSATDERAVRPARLGVAAGDFVIFGYDDLSSDSCMLETQCAERPSCPWGFYPAEDRPCYGDKHLNMRVLRCCRLQRPHDGDQTGVETVGTQAAGMVVFSCCMGCYAGTSNNACRPNDSGVCTDCPADTFNADTTPMSPCQTCMSCDAGKARTGCGGEHDGWCAACPAGSFKAGAEAA